MAPSTLEGGGYSLDLAFSIFSSPSAVGLDGSIRERNAAGEDEGSPTSESKCRRWRSKGMGLRELKGDLLVQDVDAIVNPWNRNFIPWWLLLPQGVSGAIKRAGGTRPFTEVRRHGLLNLGQAVATTAGKLPFQAIIHVAGLHASWVASERSIRLSTTNALRLAMEMELNSLAFPIIGGGTGGAQVQQAAGWMREVIAAEPHPGDTRLIFFAP